MYSKEYKDQFSLLLKILPCLKTQDKFSLKGGTAINLFYRDFPRISVDIDLTYTRIESREDTIRNMNSGLEHLDSLIMERVPGVRINRRLSRNNDYIVKLNVTDNKSIVKIEPNFIFRGTIYPSKNLTISKRITQEFGQFIDDVPMVSFNDVFAGKICAALNRQHPRDLFDIKLLLENEGLSDELRRAFVVYLASDSRPINELLNPNYLDISALYKKEFQDMTAVPVSLDELKDVRKRLIKTLLRSLTEDERRFLISVKAGEPDYSLLPIRDLDQLPALKWKIINIHKMDKRKHAMMIGKLSTILEI